MPFSSDACSLAWMQNSLILRRGQTTLQIIPEDATNLRTMRDEELFGQYFRATALKNREARRVFEAWERKDKALLKKVFDEMTGN